MDKRYESQKMGVCNLKFELQKKREDHIFLQNPFPGDPRFSKANAHDNLFDLPDINIEVLSNKRRTVAIPNLSLIHISEPTRPY